MEAPLLVKAEEEEKNIRWEKLKKVASMAAPMVAVNLSQYLLQATSTMIVGHQSEVSLAGIALASSFANVTGFSLLFGLSGALETLCGQAFGAKQHQKLGSYTFTSIVSLLIVCFPVSLLWIFIKKILLSFHQDPQVSEIASVYCLWLIPALFGYSVLQSLVRYLQSQRLIFPMVLSSLTALCIHIPVCWVLVYSLGFGAKGAAISISLSHCLNAVSLWVFAKRSRACEETRIQISKEAFGHMKAFFKLAVPSALMICLEWSAFEILILLSGLLPNAKLETSVISMIFTTSSLHYNLASAVGAAASTNVANELGAGNPVAASASAFLAITIAASESSIVSIALFFLRGVWGYAYSDVEEVTRYAAEITPILCVSIVMDSVSAALTGIIRGAGRQGIGAYVNIGAFYLVGIPVAILLCFVLHLNAKGLWIGIFSGCTLQTVTLLLVTAFTSWSEEAMKARENL
ncbi:PREDICTED: protein DETOXIFICATION 9-like isoform X2 [Tarenaya hassleriana]|uniref:protein DETOXIFICATION 9-like isoform X2 n=1 Tax=Tarenaya hassleriana TaxID=28532 RepID=UPI00053C6205|nr:PREDICTED: protein DETOXIFICATION 9-like isoform X2 [Tarenaya hassleriana]